MASRPTVWWLPLPVFRLWEERTGLEPTSHDLAVVSMFHVFFAGLFILASPQPAEPPSGAPGLPASGAPGPDDPAGVLPSPLRHADRVLRLRPPPAVDVPQDQPGLPGEPAGEGGGHPRQRSYRQQTLRSYRVGLVWFSGDPCFQERRIRYFMNPYAFTLIPLQGYVPRPLISILLSPLPEGDSIQVPQLVSFLEVQTLPTELPKRGIPIGYDMAKSRRAEGDMFLQNDTGSKIVRGPPPLKLSVSLFVEHSDLDIVHNFEDKEGCYCLKCTVGTPFHNADKGSPFFCQSCMVGFAVIANFCGSPFCSSVCWTFW